MRNHSSPKWPISCLANAFYASVLAQLPVFPHPMNVDNVCGQCGTSYPSLGALSYHTRSCKKVNKRLSASFDTARDSFYAKKCCIQEQLSGSTQHLTSLGPTHTRNSEPPHSEMALPDSTATDENPRNVRLAPLQSYPLKSYMTY